MTKPTIKTLKELQESSYQPKSIQQELAENLKKKILNGQNAFEGIHGYDHTVIPNLERAILSGHNINLMGLRGQAKTRLARGMTNLLDEWIPIIKGSELNDDPLNPITLEGKSIIDHEKDRTPIDWLHRSERFFEKLATPDVTVADLIGDIDPIKASQLKLTYADQRVIHFGMIPRAHRCIFALNELPDLQARIQVSLFSILQEKEIQIRGFKIRLPLNVLFVFTANPEDYTNRGSIVTPLKDRIGSQILTHYPRSIDIAKTITLQEAQVQNITTDKITVPELAMDLLEQISFEARNSEYVDNRSGVSARLSISAYENLTSNAQRRLLRTKQKTTQIRISDFLGTISAINGKIELTYEGEQLGPEKVAFELINQSIKTLLPKHFPPIKKLTKTEEKDSYDFLIQWFMEDHQIELTDQMTDTKRKKIISSVPGLEEFVLSKSKKLDSKDVLFHAEFLLWGISAHKKISRYQISGGYRFKDSIGSFINRL